MTTAQFLRAVAKLGCGHVHDPIVFRGFAQYGGQWCPEYARLVAAQREGHRAVVYPRRLA